MKDQQGSTSRPVFLLALCFYLAFLVFAAPIDDFDGSVSQLSVWEISSPWSLEMLSARAETLAVRALWHIVLFLPVGLFAGLAFPTSQQWLTRLSFILVPAILLSVLLSAVVLAATRSWSLPGPLALVFPSLGCALGAWLGVSTRRGWLSLFMFFPKLAILAALVLGVMVAGLYLAVERAPLDIATPEVSSDHRRELVYRFRDNNPVKLREGETRELELSPRDLDALAAWAFSIVAATPRVAFETSQDAMRLRGSARVPTTSRYLNVELGLRGAVTAGAPELELTRLRVGRIEMPNAVLGPASALVETTLRHDRTAEPVLSEIRRLSATERGLIVRYGRMDVRGTLLPALLARLGPDEAVLDAARAQIRHLASAAPTLAGDGNQRFGASLETTFALAKERSAAGSPVVENSGAILALATVLGHPRLSVVSGLEAEERTIAAARRELGRVTLRDRADWTQHFFVSAGLTQLSSAAVSDAAGSLKEELDADTEAGGSGFSFADLLADRAGTVFARTATLNAVRAGEMQRRLADGFRVEDFFPSADGLAEGISDEALEASYGGVGGAEYSRVVADIEGRLSRCAAYR